LVSRGITRTGEIYCMSCGEFVEAGTSQCPSCDSILDTEVKAFRCPRCERVNEFGTPECTGCGMHFKVKTLKLEGPSEESIVSELLGEEAGEVEEAAVPDHDEPRGSGTDEGDLDDQLAKREELVDRKIKGYALKMKDLMAREHALEERIAEFEKRIEGAGTSGEPAPELETGYEARLVEEVSAAVKRGRSLLAKVAGEEMGLLPDAGFEPLMDALEKEINGLLEDRERLETKMTESAEDEDELRRLMKALDQMLEKLPEDVVAEFAKTPEYNLYERLLDRLKL
jgi:chromosome segregation ATPase/phage FluMu protein Com